MRSFLRENKKGAIIVCINGRKWWHWAVVKAVEDTGAERIIFKDAFIKKKGFKKIKCTTRKATKQKPHIIKPTHAFFITQKNKV